MPGPRRVAEAVRAGGAGRVAGRLRVARPGWGGSVAQAGGDGRAGSGSVLRTAWARLWGAVQSAPAGGTAPGLAGRRRGRAALMVALLTAGLAGLAACAPMPPAGETQRLAPVAAAVELPAMRRFGPQPAAPLPIRSNRELAADILELGFYMESGRPIPQFSRFEGPVTVRLTGDIPPGAAEEAARLIARLQREAGLQVALGSSAPPGHGVITVEFLPRRTMQRAVPQAACFILPNISGWEEFRAARRSPRLDWTRVVVRERVAVFIPSDVPLQEVRDCLHEEVAQAMGPLNDLYRLHDSVWNDDNFQTILTGFDMLVLRVWNDPALRPGMTRAAVAAQLPQVLARLNPAGERVAAGPLPRRSPRAWVDAIERALGPGVGRSDRRAAGARALAIARAEGWGDARLAFSLFTLGRLAEPREADLALASFLQAGMIYRALGAEAHLAHVDMQLAAFALSAGQFDEADRLARAAEPAARATENAALLSSLLMVRAEALDRLGRSREAEALRLDSLGWARYGFGDDARVRARLAEIAALAPPVQAGGQRTAEQREVRQ